MSNPQQSNASATRGLWRDGQRLVVHRSIARLPDRCVKTNATTGKLQRIEHVFQWSPIGTGVALAAALATGRPSAPLTSATMETMPLSIAVSSSYLAPKRWANFISGLTVFVGVLITLAALPILMKLQATDPIMAMRMGGFVGATGIAVVVIGGVIGLLKSGIILKVVHMTDELAWFEGAHADFLTALPVLPPTHSRAK